MQKRIVRVHEEGDCITCGEHFVAYNTRKPERRGRCLRCIKKTESAAAYIRNRERDRPARLASARAYYKANKAAINKRSVAHNRKWAQENRVESRARKFARYTKLRDDVIAKLGGKCARCGFSDCRALEIEHVNGGGTAHMRVTVRETWYRQILRDESPEPVSLLCATCNWIQRRSKGSRRAALYRLCGIEQYASSQANVRRRVVEALGARCACGETRIDLLHLDHVKGGGNSDRKSKSRHQIYREMLAAPPGTFQVLCPNCNAIKKRTNPAEKPGPRTVDSADQ